MRKSNQIILLLFFTCVAIRVGFWFVYEPIISNDSGEYEKLALQISNLDFSEYNGGRTPVYPILLILSGHNYETVWLLQSIIGVSISLILFRLCKDQTDNNKLAFFVGLSYSVCLTQIFFEPMIRNETLSTFIFVLSLWIFLTIYRNKEDDKWHYVALSILVSLAGLTKPLLLLLGPIYASFFILIWLSKPISIFSKKSYFLCFILPYVIIILTWCLFNKITVDYFGPTTYTSYNLTQHSGAFIELAPDRYSTIKEIYLKHRQKRVSESGSHSMTIWRALPEMQAATGLDFSHLSQKLTSISIELFIQHPLLYFKSVFKAWAKFWETTLYWRLDRITPLGIRKVIQYVWVIQRSLLAGLYVIFSAIVIRWIDFIIFKKSSGSVFNSLLIFIILVSSVAQSLLEFGENSRYAIPFQPLILYLVFVNMWFYIASYHKASNIN